MAATNTTVAYQLIGQGPQRVIVLHGWFGDHTAFEPTFPFLDTEQFTYAFLDYRGYGASREVAGEYTLAEIGRDAVAVAEQLGWEQFHVIGHSMGGMVAQWLAAQYPNRVQSIIGITPVPACGFPFDDATRALFRGAKDSAENRYNILMHTTGNRLTPRFGKLMTERSLAQTTPEAFDAYLTAWHQSDFSEQVEGCVVPFKVIVGMHDPAITVERIRETVMKWFPNAFLECVENAGHYPMIEAPVDLVTVCEKFILEAPQLVEAQAQLT